MNQFSNILEKSKAIHRFMEVERLTQDQVYELYLECFCAYRDMFMERIHYATELRRVLAMYKPIPEFGTLKPSELKQVVFTSALMHKWFVFRFWQAIERQVTTGRIDAVELQLQLTFINQMPSTEYMEEILNDKKEKLQRKHAGNYTARIATTEGS